MEGDLVDKINKTLKDKDFRKLYTPISFNEYLEIIKSKPEVVKTSFQRLYSMIEHYGFTENEKKKKHYKLFDDPFDNGKYAVFGLDPTLIDLINCIKAGAEGFPIKERVLLLKGPPATGKSTIIRLLKKGLEEYSKIDEGATYSFFWKMDDKVIECPMHEDPLKLIPSEHRQEIFKELGINLNIEDDLCPTCYEQYKTLLEKYDGDWKKIFDNIKVKRIIFSEKRKVGIGTVHPKGEKEVVKDYLKKVNNELAVSNRGLVEFIDLFKTEGPLNILLEASQSHKIEYENKEIGIDTIILANTNDPDYKNILTDRKKTAFKDRLIDISTPRILSINEEEKIYKKDFDINKLKKRKEHISPHVLKMAAMFAVLTRFNDQDLDEEYTELKIKYYNHEKTDLEEEEIEELKKLCKKEAFEESAISPREMQNILSRLTTSERFEKTKCINSFALFSEIEKTLSESTERFTDTDKKSYLERLDFVRDAVYFKEYKDEVYEAIIGGEDAIEEQFNDYINQIKAFTCDEKIKNKFTGKEEVPNEEFMRSIENKLDEGGLFSKDYREAVIEEIAAYHSKGKKFDYKTYSKSSKKENYKEIPKLIEAVRETLFEGKSEILEKLRLMKHKTLNEKDKKQVDKVKNRLINNFGYCEHCATLVLTDFPEYFSYYTKA